MTHLVVALWPEAKPLIAHLGLARVAPRAPFRHHHGDGISLVVSGVGKTAAAAAVGYLFAAEGARRDRSWINFGIAGHGSHAVGTGLLADKVEDAGSGRVWYPRPVVEIPAAATAAVCTVDRVGDDYPPDVACDMEAAGFFAAACRFTPAELVQIYKVVSDGSASDRRSLDAARVSALMAPHAAVIERLIAATRARADELAAARPETDPGPSASGGSSTAGHGASGRRGKGEP